MKHDLPPSPDNARAAKVIRGRRSKPAGIVVIDPERPCSSGSPCAPRQSAIRRKVVKDDDFVALRNEFMAGFYAAGDPNLTDKDNLTTAQSFPDTGSFFGLQKKRSHDGLILGFVTFAQGFMSPRRQRTRDTLSVDSTFPSGGLNSTLVLTDPVTESLLHEPTFISGAYLLTVVYADDVEDNLNLDHTFVSGSYTLRAVLSEAPGDALLVDSTVQPGEYVLRITNPQTEGETLPLTITFDSGIYG